ncbi:MAG: SLATT domain-containing protein [Bacteroidales bacterium]|nr:SLATT domain-containing protein [Bacteroidales bacterium]
METTLEKLRRIKVDCLYGKKKHFNAADRHENNHYYLGIPLTLINILTGTVLFYVLTEDTSGLLKYIPIIFAFIAALLSGFQTYFNFNKSAEGHRRLGNRYLATMKTIDRLQGYIDDKLLDVTEIISKLENIAGEVDEINKDAEQFPTTKKDYNLARQGIEGGEEDYTSKELNL